MTEQAIEIETHITSVMAQIAEAASKKDLMAIQALYRKAEELQALKEQVAAIEKRLISLSTEQSSNNPLVTKEPSHGEIRKLPIEVTDGDIRQNLLKLTPHIKRGKIKVGEELLIEAHPSGDRFQTVVLAKGNKLQERGKIARFYKDAKVQPGDFVLLTEETPGRWSLKKAPLGQYSRYK